MLEELKNSNYTRYHIELINRSCGGWLVKLCDPSLTCAILSTLEVILYEKVLYICCLQLKLLQQSTQFHLESGR